MMTASVVYLPPPVAGGFGVPFGAAYVPAVEDPTDSASPEPTVTVTATATPDPTAPQYVAVQSVSPEMAYVLAVPVFLLSALLVVVFALVVRGGGS